MSNDNARSKDELYKQLAAQCRTLNENLYITKLELNKLTKVSRENVINQIGIINGSLLMGANKYFETQLAQRADKLEEETAEQQQQQQQQQDGSEDTSTARAEQQEQA
ncbi:hypothetical protein ACO0QE_002118 [Hanseniaspora vineae]